MDHWCVYILQGKRYYIGSTNNLERRLKEHQISGYSAKRIGNRRCLGFISCINGLEARRLEREIKKSCHPERYVIKDIFTEYSRR